MERSVILRAFTDNPIVLRDLRATMRGTRAFWFQGAYLGLLGILAVTGYAISTHQDLFSSMVHSTYGPRAVSIVDAQSQLQQFYYYIFITLAALITLIAPALTATSVSDERQRQSLDLLVTTPLSAFEMLTGKLISSLAFLGILLALSFPASALCVLLGGATISDMFRVYIMLAMDAVVLASIGLYFSCACKNSLQAIIWTYAATIPFTFLMFFGLALGSSGNNNNLTSIHDMPPFVVFAALSPFAAIIPMVGQNVVINGIALFPIWVAMIPVAFATVRLLLTAATYRFGMFGGESGRSLRKQILGYTAVAALAFGYSLVQSNSVIYSYNDTITIANTPLPYLVIGGMCLLLAFLPGLFVPVKPEDAPPGETHSAQSEREHGWFRWSALLLPRHAGALPYYLTCLTIAFGGVAIGAAFDTHGGFPIIATNLVCGFVYAVGVGIFVWGVARLAAQLIRSASSARALTFGIVILLTMLPVLPLSLASGDTWGATPLSILWIGSPMMEFYKEGMNRLLALVASGMVAGVLGMTIGMAGPRQKA